jgi:hypothetical protein
LHHLVEGLFTIPGTPRFGPPWRGCPGYDDTHRIRDLDVSRSMTIVGVGPTATDIGGQNNGRRFDVHGDVRVKLLNPAPVRGGNLSTDDGAIRAMPTSGVVG